MDTRKIFIERLVYPAMERIKGNRIRQGLNELAQSEAWDTERLMKKQSEKLETLLKSCIKNVPAYQKLGITEDEIEKDPFACLMSKVPALRREAFQLHAGDYLSADADPSALIINRTGGSSGRPVTFYMDRKTVEYYEAARWRGLSWFGITPGSRSVMIWGNPIELSARSQRRRRLEDEYLKNRIIISAYELSDQKIEEQAALINRFRPEYLYGYATALTAFAGMLQRRGISLKISLKAVVSTSETLFPEQRELLGRVFRCPVANEYGARDAGILAYSCPCGSLHITYENAVVEVLDPATLRPAAEGEDGLVAVTDLNNFVQPRLRYLLGDVGVAGHAPCACKRSLPVLSKLEGREDALLVRGDGTLIHGNFLNQLTRKRQSILKFQLIQASPSDATVNLVLRGDVPDDSEEYLSDIRSMLPGVKLTCRKVSDIPLSASGKERYAVRAFPLN